VTLNGLTIKSLDSSKPKGWFELIVEGKPPFLVDSETIFKHSLKSGLEISEDFYTKIRGEADIAWLKNKAMQILARHMISERDLRRKLTNEGRAKWVRDEVIIQLKRYNFIDDGKYAATFIRTQLSRGPKSRIYLLQKLREKGISEEYAKPAVEAEYAGYDEKGAVKELAAKKYKSVKHLPVQKAKNKVISFLRSRGFSWNAISEAIKNIFNDTDNDTEY
jgi:regulatory protein